MTIQDFAAGLKSQLERMQAAPPDAEIAALDIISESGRKRRGDADLAKFHVTDQIRISFRPRSLADNRPASASSHAADLARALEKAERHPGHAFVSLKWFRDAYLPQTHAWAADAVARQNAVRQALEAGWVTAYRVPNPKNPRFPATALRLNRAHGSLKSLLPAAQPRGWDFTPIKIEGEPLSQTVRRMRDEGY